MYQDSPASKADCLKFNIRDETTWHIADKDIEMRWKHYSVLHKSIVIAYSQMDVFECHVEIGRVHTGRARVYMGGYCRVAYGENTICGEESTIWMSVIKVVEMMNRIGINLPIYAIDPDFHESGLSADTGWGYVRGKSVPVLMITQIDENAKGCNNDS